MTSPPIVLLLMLLLASFADVSHGFLSQASSVRSNATCRLQMSSVDLSDLRVMVNGMPGSMATAAAEACLRKGLKLAPCAITGPDISPATITVADVESGRSANVKLIPSSNSEEADSALEGLKAGCGPNNLIAVDFTHPSAVNANALWYVEHKLPFVMGTTGGDREKLLSDVREGNISAVIAPNMAKQIVAMQAALEDLSSKYPDAFGGYKLEVTESHQKTKADTSGTAKAVVRNLKTLSGDEDFDEKDIKKIRSDEESMAFGVPKDALSGHAFHTYKLTSADETVQFGLMHNVCGRSVYADGTADAVKFLAKKLKTEEEVKVYNMVDVLEEGALG